MPAKVEPGVEVLNLFRAWNQLAAIEPRDGYRTIGLLLWPRQETVSKYFVALPGTLAQLIEFAEDLGISLLQSLTSARELGAFLLQGIPLVFAIPRPAVLIGSSSTLEFLSFLLIAEGTDWEPASVVYPLAHRAPLSPTFARDLSSVVATRVVSKPLMLGCGALGSKIALHLARSGVVEQCLVDWAQLSPHHLVRHALLADKLGTNKAQGVCETIADMYRMKAEELGVSSLAESVLDCLRNHEVIAERTIIVDATASQAVLEAIVATELPEHTPICRCEIADEGKLGFLSLEGPSRNPRLDDLHAKLLDLSLSHEGVGSWIRTAKRRRDKREPQLEDIDIGLGCSSATMRLADDTTAVHAASFSRGLRSISESSRQSGKLLITELSHDAISSTRLDVESVLILSLGRAVGWSLRIAKEAVSDMRGALKQRAPYETGGVLIGFAHEKRKIVYVTRILLESPQSHGSIEGFLRAEDYVNEVRTIEETTGGLLGYVGEWHTHPAGGTEPSERDLVAMADIRGTMANSGASSVVAIVAPGQLAAYLC